MVTGACILSPGIRVREPGIINIGEMTMTCVLVPLAKSCEELEVETIIDLLRRADIEVVAAEEHSNISGNTVTAWRRAWLEIRVSQAIIAV